MRRLWLILALANPLGMLAWYLRLTDRPLRNDVLAIAILAVVMALALGSVYLILRPVAGRRNWGTRLAAINLLVVLWFTAVEERYLIEDCARCRNFRHIQIFSLMGIGLARVERPWDHPTLIEWVAADLGEPCTHRGSVATLITSVDGLLVGYGMCGMHIFDRPWYPPCARDYVRSRAATDPAFVREFRAKVLDEFDQAYWRDLLARMKAACPPDALPEREGGQTPSSEVEAARADEETPDRG